jgi:phosphopantetheinyl transferase (holo-ACP synthase)
MMRVGNDIGAGKDISTGNDIIALAETDNDRTSRHRFYSRILAPEELLLFPAPNLPFSVFVWLMWSIKESVYKYVSRADPGLRFAPLKIPVRGLRICQDHYEGIICYSDLTMFSRSFLWDKGIMTVVSAGEDFSNVRWGMEVIGNSGYTTQSALVRKFALQSLSTDFPGAALRIIKTPDGPPELWDGERSLDIPLSLAHHGPYVAWSYRLPGHNSYRLPANSSSYRKSAANRAASSHLRRVNLPEITGLKRSCSSCEYSS